MIARRLLIGCCLGGVVGTFGTVAAPIFAFWMLGLTLWHGAILTWDRWSRFQILIAALGAGMVYAFFHAMHLWNEGYWLKPEPPHRELVIAGGILLGGIGFGLRGVDLATRKPKSKEAGK